MNGIPHRKNPLDFTVYDVTASDARELGPVAFPHYEMLQRLRAAPSHGMKEERFGPVTQGAIVDALETLQAIYADNAAKLELDGSASVETRARVKEQAHLAGAISILHKKENEGRGHADDGTNDRAPDDDVSALGARQFRQRP